MGMKSALIRTTGVLDAIGSSLGLIFKADVLIGFYLGALAAAGGGLAYMWLMTKVLSMILMIMSMVRYQWAMMAL